VTHLDKGQAVSILEAAMANVSTVSPMVPPRAAAAFAFIAAHILKKNCKLAKTSTPLVDEKNISPAISIR
jgi:hypothetical protein